MQSSNSNSSSDEDQVPKRYNLPMQLGLKQSDVCRKTRKRWELRIAESKRFKATVSTLESPQKSSSSSSEHDHLSQEEPSSISTNNADEMIQVADQQFTTNRNSPRSDENVPTLNVHTTPSEDEDGDENCSFENYSLFNDNDEIQSEIDESDSDDDIFTNQTIDFFDQTMFYESNLKVRDVITMITALSLDLKLSDEGKIKLGKFTKVLAGKKFDNLNLSKHMMKKCFSSQDEHVTYNFYCSKCTAVKLYSVKASEKSRNKEIVCHNCRAKIKITPRSSNYFLRVDLKYQIRLLLTDPVIIDDIMSNVKSRNLNSHCNKDVNAGSIQKNIIADTSNSDIMLTVNMNTDGAPLTKSGKRGFWPVQIILNDLSPKLRFRNVLQSGLLLTETEPHSNLLDIYLSEVYVNQMNELYTQGIAISYKGNEIVFKCCTHACPVDSVCRPIVQNRIQFNGYYGCSWGYQLGEYITSVRGVRYPVNQTEAERTNDSHKEDVESVSESGKVTNGVKGESVMSQLAHFDIVWSFPYEYLHALCLGSALQIWNEWKNGDSQFKISKKQVDFIEQRFLHVTPTQEIHRLPRSGIIKGSAKPKASEMKAWLLYYSLPCLHNVLPEEALKHYSLLVNSAFTALKPAQSESELDKCDDDLLRFEVDYEKHYGKEKMTFNIHILRHMVSSIRKTGSLCYNSAFPFESYIYKLKTYVNGPNGMDRQISRKHLQYLLFKTGNIETISTSDTTKMFCSSLFNPIKYSKSFRHGADIVYCGKSELKNVDRFGKCTVYKRCIYKNTVYHSEKYAKSKKTNDSVILLHSGEYAKIIDIIEYNAKPYIQVRIFNVFPELPFEDVEHIRKIQSECSNKIVKPVSDIECKVLLVNVRNARYLCKMPNDFEVQ